MNKDYNMKTQINPRFDEEVYICVHDYLTKNGWKLGVNYSSLVEQLVHEIVFGSFDKSLVFEYNLFDDGTMYKVSNKSTLIRTSDKRSLVKVAKSKQSTMTELLNDQIRKHMIVVAKR